MKKMRFLSQTELEPLLLQLIAWGALELYENKEEKQILIPYVMNDSVECYKFVAKNP